MGFRITSYFGGVCLVAALRSSAALSSTVHSALVFRGRGARELGDDAFAAACLTDAISGILGWPDRVPVVALTATPYVSVDGPSDDTKVSFSVVAHNIDPAFVRDALLAATRLPPSGAPSPFAATLAACWEYDDLDAAATAHVLRTETVAHAERAVVTSALVFDGFAARNFAADAVAVATLRVVVAAVLGAATLQVDNVAAEDYHGRGAHAGTVPRGSVVSFDVATHAWPVGADALETPEDVAGALIEALDRGRVADALRLYAAPCDCVLAAGAVNVFASEAAIDETTLGGPPSEPPGSGGGGGGGGPPSEPPGSGGGGGGGGGGGKSRGVWVGVAVAAAAVAACVFTAGAVTRRRRPARRAPGGDVEIRPAPTKNPITPALREE